MTKLPPPASGVIKTVTREIELSRNTNEKKVEARQLELDNDITFENHIIKVTEATLSTQAVREYLSDLWKQYHKGSRRLKSKILDEVCRNLAIHRKAAIRLMNSHHSPRSLQGLKGDRRRKYSEESKYHLAQLRHLMDYMCSVRMKAALGVWIEFYEHKDLSDNIRDEILSLSESSIKRFLATERAKLRRKVNSGTRPGVRRFVTQVPIRDFDKTPNELGHCEVDCVAHCGDSISGQFAWTLTLTDIYSGWTECEAIWAKNGSEVRKALKRIEARLPFSLKALYCDNGSEFINRDIIEYFAKNDHRHELPVYRGRPRRKNDQCYVEQKNYTHVRSLFGYGRISWKPAIKMMNKIYRNEWRKLQNLFMPQQKLSEKIRKGSSIIRKMEKPQTPYERVRPIIQGRELMKLRELRQGANPIELRKSQRKSIRNLFGYFKDEIHRGEWGKMAI